MSKKTRKVSFYRLALTHNIEVNSKFSQDLTNHEIEEKFKFIYNEKTTPLRGGERAVNISTPASDYVIEIIDYSNHRAFIKIGQQNPSNTVALRDMTTLETEEVPMKESQSLELYTFFLIDFETCIVSYIGINGAPKVSAIRTLFNEFLENDRTFANLAAIMTDDILQILVSENIISKVSITVATPEDSILSYIGVNENSFDSLRNVKTSTATYNLVAQKNKSVFNNSSDLGIWFASIMEKFGGNVKKISANAKDHHEKSQTYDLLQYNFTKTVVLSDDNNKYPTIFEYREALERTYNTYKAELVRYSRI